MPLTRRYFFATTLIPAGGFGSVASLRRLGFKSPNEKLNVAAIGAGGKGLWGHSGLQGRKHRRPLRCG